MDNFPTRIAHSPEASTDELASPPPLAEAPAAAAPPPAAEEPRFATAAEQEAYLLGLRNGAKAAHAEAGSRPGRHAPAGLDLGLTREGDALGLVAAGGLEPSAGADPAAPRRALRHDGWTPEKEATFLRTLAATGVIGDACRACGMSRTAAYQRRNGNLQGAFALIWDAALVLGRPALADDVMSRARHGVVERIYRNGELVAERHRHDNRLAMAVLTRLDRIVEGLGERAPAVQAVAREFDSFLDLLPQGDEAAEAFLQSRIAGGGRGPEHRQASATAGTVRPRPGGGASRLRRDDVFDGDLDPDEMESWTDDQLRRAEMSGLVDCLYDQFWPAEALDGEADGTDGMCKLRKLYLRCRSNNAGEDYWTEE